MKVLISTAIIVFIDQATKLLVKGFSLPSIHLFHKGMYPGEKIKIAGDWLNITFVENPGIAFGIDFGIKYKLLLTLFTAAATIVLLVYLYYNRNKSLLMRLAICCLLGGALGNLIDRSLYGLLYGYAPFGYGMVVDFIDVRFFNLFVFNRTLGNYVLNFADLAITAGVVLLFFAFGREKEKSVSTDTAAPGNALAEDKD